MKLTCTGLDVAYARPIAVEPARHAPPASGPLATSQRKLRHLPISLARCRHSAKRRARRWPNRLKRSMSTRPLGSESARAVVHLPRFPRPSRRAPRREAPARRKPPPGYVVPKVHRLPEEYSASRDDQEGPLPNTSATRGSAPARIATGRQKHVEGAAGNGVGRQITFARTTRPSPSATVCTTCHSKGERTSAGSPHECG